MQPRLLYIINRFEAKYLKGIARYLKKDFSLVIPSSESISGRIGIGMLCKKFNCTHVMTSDFAVFKTVAHAVEGTAADNYGTYLEFESIGVKIKFIFVPPAKNVFAQNHGAFLLERYSAKLKGGFVYKDAFKWEFITPDNIEQVTAELEASSLAAVDIETERPCKSITSVAYTYLLPNNTSATYVVKCSEDEYPFCISAVRILNRTKCMKIMQNGSYDSTYFIRFNAPLRNYIFDTNHLFACLFAELPKDLSFISSFFLQNFVYWKDEAGQNLYEYNGKDTHNTLWVFIAMINYIETENCQYAYKNYLLRFPVLFPAISCGLEGIAVDEDRRAEARTKAVQVMADTSERLNYLLGEEDFNPNSPKQVLEMMRAVGYTKAESTDKRVMEDFANANPLYRLLVTLVQEYRKSSKAIGTYFDVELIEGRMLYELNPSGTKTGRMASKESNLWCGSNIQNQPPYARKMFKADDGWVLAAVDKAQAESYCTAYISQDLNCIDSVTTSPDFHCQNASMFFGIPFDQLYDAVNKKKLNVKIRDLSKRVNHGANYNMMAGKLLETMGAKNVYEAKKLLHLNLLTHLVDVCQNLLARFDRAFPRIRGDWYQELINEVRTTEKLYIACIGYTRRTFLKPWGNKEHLNEVVAHKPQSLSVHLINKAMVKIWRELQLKKYRGKFRLKMQIHDELMFQVTPDILEQASQEVADMMVIPTEIEGRTMVIPSTIATGEYWNECK